MSTSRKPKTARRASTPPARKVTVPRSRRLPKAAAPVEAPLHQLIAQLENQLKAAEARIAALEAAHPNVLRRGICPPRDRERDRWPDDNTAPGWPLPLAPTCPSLEPNDPGPRDWERPYRLPEITCEARAETPSLRDGIGGRGEVAQ